MSCSADRNIKAKINKDGIWIEKLDDNPTELIPETAHEMVNKYGTYEIQPTNDTKNPFPPSRGF